ncbi:hypothetical protein C1Y40_05138 [Mycobacterium talmoniae]|uniref:AMP-binding enzyme C-terminal domain-containing protein n=1 Tax=Mycobacterium talmoniae TaxID=1858794 RepID=A0A2S8BDJ0_9MYCO|nr:hypothetical protein C1Y40_05138 [Mycobacterium talmoniae]
MVALADGAAADAAALIEHAATSIARYKLPKAVVFREVIVRSPAARPTTAGPASRPSRASRMRYAPSVY